MRFMSQVILFCLLGSVLRGAEASGPMINEFIAMLKDTSLVATIGAEELTHQGRILYSVTYEAAWIWGTVALIYLLLTRLLSMLGDYLERRLATE